MDKKSRSSIAFFPWLTLKGPMEIEGIRLVPYIKEVDPRSLPNAALSDIDTVLSAYAIRKGELVEEAALMEVDTWRSGDDVPGDMLERLYRARDLLAFSALARRDMFFPGKYCNFHTFSLVVQRYAPGTSSAFSFAVRRRGQGIRHVWDAEEFAFLKPIHVEAVSRPNFDEQLLRQMRRADAKDDLPYSAIAEYNMANTDSYDVPAHVELVMMKSAFEFFFEINQNVENLVLKLLPEVREFVPTAEFPCPKFAEWAKRFPGMRPLEAWAREFCQRRNEAGHGAMRNHPRHIWSVDEHLNFAAKLFPMLVKKKLHALGYENVTRTQEIEIQWVEALLGYEQFAQRKLGEPHPWERVYNDGVMDEALHDQVEKAFGDLDSEKRDLLAGGQVEPE